MQGRSATEQRTVGGEDRAVVRYLFERIYSKGELSHVDDLVAADRVVVSTESADTYLGPDGVRTHVKRLRRAFHGLTFEIDALHVDGVSFGSKWTARGTHEHRFLGVDPTCLIGPAGEDPHGPRIAVTGGTRGTIEEGTVHELRMDWDEEALRLQLGGPVDSAGLLSPVCLSSNV